MCNRDLRFQQLLLCQHRLQSEIATRRMKMICLIFGMAWKMWLEARRWKRKSGIWGQYAAVAFRPAESDFHDCCWGTSKARWEDVSCPKAGAGDDKTTQGCKSVNEVLHTFTRIYTLSLHKYKCITHVYTILHKGTHAITLAFMFYTLRYYLLHIMSFSITHYEFTYYTWGKVITHTITHTCIYYT